MLYYFWNGDKVPDRWFASDPPQPSTISVWWELRSHASHALNALLTRFPSWPLLLRKSIFPHPPALETEYGICNMRNQLKGAGARFAITPLRLPYHPTVMSGPGEGGIDFSSS